MASSIGNSFKIALFGESHNQYIGVTLFNVASGIKLDLQFIKDNLSKRRPKYQFETKRVEDDDFEIISGFFNGYTTGAPLTFLIKNTDVNSKDYTEIKNIFRPSHVDYGNYQKSFGFEDYRGSGHFSGRLTAPLVIAGSVALQILASNGIIVKTHIKKVLDLYDDSFDEKTIFNQLKLIEKNKYPVINTDFLNKLSNLLNDIEDDSVGGSFESIVLNVEAGLGEPYFSKLDSLIAYYLMSIPTIKGVSFGLGFQFSNHYSSEVLDEYYYDNGIKTYTNHSGGIIGGLANGGNIIINSVSKPIATINKTVKTVEKDSNKEVLFKAKGRHDKTIISRLPIIIDSLIALAVIDLYCVRYGYMWQVKKNV